MKGRGCLKLSNLTDYFPSAEFWEPEAFFLFSLSLSVKAGNSSADLASLCTLWISSVVVGIHSIGQESFMKIPFIFLIFAEKAEEIHEPQD